MDQELYSLVNQAKSGDKEAFSALVSRFKDHVFRYSFGMLGDRMEAEDAAQEAFIKAYYSLPKLENEFAFTSWLTRIVSHLCYDKLRKKKQQYKAITEHQNERRLSGDAGGGVSLGRKDMQLEIEEAMSKLTPAHREAVILRDVQGYSYEEIASLLGIPVGTVKSRINTARLLLRNEIRQQEGGM